jgi:CMP/dCMP kinase
MIIIISGLPGAGKSTVAKLVAQKLDYKHYSTGDIQRDLAKKKGVSLKEWHDIQVKDPQSDIMVDDCTKDVLRNEGDIVFDSWVAPCFADDAIKVFLTCEETERARRRVMQKRKEEKFETIEESVLGMRERVENNRQRWIKLYNYDFLEMAQYDLIIDTTKITIDQVAEKVVNYIKDFI